MCMKNFIKATSIFILLLTIGCNNPKKEVPQIKETSTEVKPLFAMEQGLQYALKTKSILGKNLLGAIKSKGTVGALSFCNENSIHLTDSATSQNEGVEVKRVSDKNRNPNNRANVNELSYIEKVKNQLMYGKKITPQIQEIDGKMDAMSRKFDFGY